MCVIVTQVHSLEEDGKPAPVCCIEVERGPESKVVIIATTRKRLFQFVGRVAEGSEQQGFSSVFSQNQVCLQLLFLNNRANGNLFTM